MMSVRMLLAALGGPSVVARACSVSVQAASNWGARDAIPRQHHVTLWRLAIAAGLDWAPVEAEGMKLVPKEVA